MKQIVKLTKTEANILLGFASTNRDCDVDCCRSNEKEMVDYVLETYGTDLEKEVKKIWNTIIKKLKAIK